MNRLSISSPRPFARLKQLARRLNNVLQRNLIERPKFVARDCLFRLALRRRRLAVLYYLLFDRSFDRELHAVLNGKALHQSCRTVSCGDPGNFTLRRNIHRLEKGLIMRPMRDVFALEYIEETVAAYAELVVQDLPSSSSSGDVDPLEAWADDVLSRYFDHCRGNPVVDRVEEIFRNARRCYREPGNAFPFRLDTTPLSTTIEDLQQLALRRRSVRWYQQRPVPREVIDAAIDVARYSPSACNRQPFEFRVFDDPALIHTLGSIPGGVRGFAENFPCFVVLVGRLRAYRFEYDRHLIYIDASLAAMAFLFALETQGVSSCCINWADHAEKEQQMNRLLGLDPDERVIMCMSLGYADPDGLVPFSQKKSLDQIRNYNRVSGCESPNPLEAMLASTSGS